MSSQRRAPIIPDIPPYSTKAGGPLQARHATNQTQSHYAEMRSGQKAPLKAVMAPPQNPISHQEQQKRVVTQQRDSRPSSSSQRTSTRVQPDTEPRPSSRLANEKKKDYKDPPNIGPWKLGKLIGQGASGRVRHAIHTSSGVQAAVKIVPKQILATSRMSMRDVSAKQDKMTLGIEREIVIMKLIEHPNLLGLIDVYETSKELFLILEYVAGGELFDYLVSKGRLRPSEARSYFRQIIFGLHYCHSFNICHRDLKPENLLLDGTRKVVKVADFGMAALQPSEKMLETSCGSPHYASPEIVSGKSYKGTASDIWSCGIILFALLCGRLPFDDPNIQTLLGKVRLGRFDMPEYLEPLAKDLIWKMLVVDPERRLTMREIMRHPWFTDNGALSSRNPVETSLDDITDDQLDVDSLDSDILNNLKTLWPEYSQANIISQLTSKGQNWQKTFYTLLVQHRENYCGDEDEDEEDEEEAQLSFVTGHASPLKNNTLGLSLGINAPPSKPAPATTTTTVVTAPVVTSATPPTIIAPLTAPTAAGKEKARPRRSMEGSNSLDDQRAAEATPAPVAATMAKNPLIRANTYNASPSTPTRGASTRSSLDPPRSPAGPRASSQLTADRPSPSRAHSMDARSPATSPIRPLPSPTITPVKSMNSPAKGIGSASHAKAAIHQDAPLVDSANLIRRATSPTNAHSPATRTINPILKSALPATPNSTRRARPVSIAQDITPRANNEARPPSRAGSITSPSRRPSSTYGEGKGLPTVGVPQVGDASMQKFFQDIADELASIRVSGGRPESLQLKLEQLERVATNMQNKIGRQASSAKKTGEEDSMAQFDDAEDDVEEGDHYSNRSGSASEASSTPYTPTSPIPLNLASPTFKTKPLAIIDRKPLSRANSNRSTSNNNTTTTSSIISNGTASQISTASNNSSLGRRRSLLMGLRKKSSSATSNASSESNTTKLTSSAFEKLQDAGAQNKHVNAPTKLQQKNPGLGLDVKTAEASTRSPALGAIASPTLPSTPLINPSPKQSWFTGLFNWKPATATLMSTENFSITHNETRRLLTNTGARVFVEDSEHAGVLKCSLAEGKEGNTKPVRFRVEFQILPMSSIASPGGLGIGSSGGSTPRSILASPALSSHSAHNSSSSSSSPAQQPHYATSVTLIQEKGSLANFKNVHHALKRSWTLDGSSSASVPSSPVVNGFHHNVGLGVTGVGNGVSPRIR